MQAIQILDVKPFMQLLFQTEILDQYLFVSATIQTDMLYTLDGHMNPDFFTEEEAVALSVEPNTYLPWKLAKEKVFLLIKGKKTPTQLKIVLRANKELSNQLLINSNSSLKSNDIHGLFLNILFQEQKLNVTCGVSYKIFTLDKSFEEDFSHSIITLFKSNSITCQ